MKLLKKSQPLPLRLLDWLLHLLGTEPSKPYSKKVFGTAEGIGPMLVYAVVVTIIAVIVAIWIGKASEKAKAKE